LIWRLAKEGVTETVSGPVVTDLDPNSKYIFLGAPGEERASAPLWNCALASRAVNCLEVVSQLERYIEVRASGNTTRRALTSAIDMEAIVGDGPIYIDISGLAHHVWAPLVRAALLRCPSVKVVYFEPDSYKAHPSPSSTSQFALSAGFRGVEPIPGFANLVGPPSDVETLFVPFLGFEGPRARQVAMTLDPIPKTIAIVGVPGFRIDYPQVTVSSNQDFLLENSANRNLRYARASCPFEAYSALAEIRRDNPGSYLYVAPLGTKPHALGAIWFALDNPVDTEIMYDHPSRMPGRTSGVGRAHIYHLKT
jgi:hypothetical protein